MTTMTILHHAKRLAMPVFALAALAIQGAALAQMPAPPQPQQQVQGSDSDPLPTRVGRVSIFSGELYRAPAERASDWESIGVNYPITNGDNLWVAQDGRAEVDFGGGQLRMGADTNVSVAQLDEHNLGLFLAQGRVNVRVRILQTGDTIFIDTPNTQLQLTRPGLYSIDVRDGATMLGVRQGAATALAGNGAQPVYPGQTAIVSGSSQTVVEIRGSSPLDGFDSWSAERDRYYERSTATNYVSREMVGAADLSQYGTWQTQPEYGNVWYPTSVAQDWTPYSDGYWTNTTGFGLTWVDAAPWGYAPFHYGRWAYVGNRWGWLPGAYVARPVWAPALVAWTGGSGWNVGISIGGPVYGWVPLGWREPYRPSWDGCGSRCWDRYNRPYNVQVNYNTFYNEAPRRPENYANWRVPGAVMAVPGAALGNRTLVNRERVPVNAAMLGAAPALREPVGVRPQPVASQLVRPGTRGAPPPASTLYSTSKPAQLGLAPTRPRTAQIPGAPGQPAKGPTVTRGNIPGAPPVPGALGASPVAPGTEMTPSKGHGAPQPPRGTNMPMREGVTPPRTLGAPNAVPPAQPMTGNTEMRPSKGNGAPQPPRPVGSPSREGMTPQAPRTPTSQFNEPTAPNGTATLPSGRTRPMPGAEAQKRAPVEQPPAPRENPRGTQVQPAKPSVEPQQAPASRNEGQAVRMAPQGQQQPQQQIQEQQRRAQPQPQRAQVPQPQAQQPQVEQAQRAPNAARGAQDNRKNNDSERDKEKDNKDKERQPR